MEPIISFFLIIFTCFEITTRVLQDQRKRAVTIMMETEKEQHWSTSRIEISAATATTHAQQ